MGMSKGIDKKLDALWAYIVKARAGGKCEAPNCSQRMYLNAHHIFGRRNKSVRWELTNGICLCPLHHTFSSTFSAHQTPTAFTQWIIAKRSEEWHEELMRMANTPKKWTKAEKEDLLAEFNRCVKV